MRILAIIVIALGLFGAAFIGIETAFKHGDYSGFLELNIADIHHALATVCAGALIALSIAGQSRGRWTGLSVALAVSLFSLTMVGLLGSMMDLGKSYWKVQPLLTFAILVAGGVVSFAIACVPKTRKPSVEEKEAPHGYDVYGFADLSMAQAKAAVESVFKTTTVPSDGGDMDAEQYCATIGDEEITLEQNYLGKDEEGTEQWVEADHKRFPLVLYVSGTARGDELKQQLLEHVPTAQLLRRDTF